jgi:hypothetical protein
MQDSRAGTSADQTLFLMPTSRGDTILFCPPFYEEGGRGASADQKLFLMPHFERIRYCSLCPPLRRRMGGRVLLIEIFLVPTFKRRIEGGFR